jgi:trimeric autotransporter adhesin
MPNGGRVFMKVLTRIIETGNQTPNLTNTATLEQVYSTDSQTSYSISSPTQTTFTATDSISSPASADIQVKQKQKISTSHSSKYVTYTITVKNNGPNNATGVQITDTLPTGVQWVSDDSQGTYNPTTGIWNIGNLNYKDTKTLKITALITGTGTIKNTATKTSETEIDNNYINDAETVVINIS